MLLRYRQLLTGSVFLLLGIVYLYFFSTVIGAVFLVGSALWFFGYFWWGPALTGYGRALRGNFASADAVLNVVGDVNKLPSRKRAYYFLTKALVEESQDNLTAAEDFFNKARCEAMLPDKEEAMIRVRLARIYLVQARDQEAATQLDRIDLSKAGRKLRAEAAALAESVKLRTETVDRQRRSLFDPEE